MLRGAARGLGWVLVAVIALVLVAPHALPVLTGHRLLVIDGGSMVPTMHPGDVVLAGPPTGDDLRVGAVLIVGTPPASYTHRVIEVRGADADRRAKLQGDANAVADPHWVHQNEVTGVPTSVISGLAATLSRTVLQPTGTLVLAAVLVGCVALLIVPRKRGPNPRDFADPGL